ncbi:glutamate--cysteine ligase catalytic subunit-like [Oppia nitens]|uniref:glutamate--cysteine ligase catalytic subunit-like n=1 Tax=Oppia nitens TaxID=1686743 RepID=UPI0023DCA5F5|nr:glutamate--cysteine ligase catalytic subunit-like [Oppia nitens]
MGLLSLGKPLSWDETKQHAEHVRQHGINQFINLFKNLKDRNDKTLKWGDEIEYMIVKFDHKNKKARLSLKAKQLLDVMDSREQLEGSNRAVLWRPEWGEWMIEGTPGKPYGIDESNYSGGGSLAHFNVVEANMKSRRQEINALLDEDEALLCITSYPRLGTDDFSHPFTKPDPKNSATRSQFLSDDVISSYHPRFKTIAENIRERRGRKVIINVPIFKDSKTVDPFNETFDDEESDSASKTDHLYLDGMGFGMGCACLQVTFQASNINEARVLYDQLTPMCPIAMALSAASPIHRGYLVDRDCRWGIISASVDDRTKEELGEEPLNHNMFRITKSRYDSIDSYLCEANDKYNDILLTYQKCYYQQMIDAGVDPMLAKHIAHLFIRDPIVVYKEKLDQNDEIETDHFENIQSTNWQTMRFKPPPPQSGIGWRVEFRPMEIQMTEFENAAYVVFIVLLTRVILSFKLNLLIPISKVDENMIEAQKRDAVKRSKFWFRKDIISLRSPPEAAKCVEATGCCSDNCCEKSDSETTPFDESCVLMSINEIINGKGQQFPGLVPLLKHYLSSIELDVDTQCTIQQYLNLIANRASGKLKTTAQWIRDYVSQHPDYKHDSIVNDTINYDLLMTCNRIQKGELNPRELVGDNPRTKTNL